jgi:hypothetical protein
MDPNLLVTIERGYKRNGKFAMEKVVQRRHSGVVFAP